MRQTYRRAAASRKPPPSRAREAFAGIDPPNTTYYVGGFIPPGVLVEVELDAVVGEAPPR